MKNKPTLMDELKRGAGYQYQQVDISTLAGLERAEQLQAQGWKLVQSGLLTVLMQKEKGIPCSNMREFDAL